MGNLAQSYGLDEDELLVSLWYRDEARFDYLRNPSTPVREKDIPYVRTFMLHSDGMRSIMEARKRALPTKIDRQEYDFSTVGNKVVDSDAYLTKDDVLEIYEALVSDFAQSSDPIQPVGVKDHSLLESAIWHQHTSFERYTKYPTAETSAAAVMYALSHNHPFYNGNKRTAIVAVLVLLDRHNICLMCDQSDLFKVSVQLANHTLVPSKNLYPDAEIYTLAKWIHKKSKVMKKGERPITLKKLRYILRRYGCEIQSDGTVTRYIKTGFFADSKILEAKRAISYTQPEGEEVDKGVVKSLREDLKLTADDGIDQGSFYEGTGLVPADFIDRYRTLLRRLSKF